jgi:hypothetical protein
MCDNIFFKALDECETTAKVFKCGVEKDAQGMADLIVGSAVKAEEDANVSYLILHCKFHGNNFLGWKRGWQFEYNLPRCPVHI